MGTLCPTEYYYEGNCHWNGSLNPLVDWRKFCLLVMEPLHEYFRIALWIFSWKSQEIFRGSFSNINLPSPNSFLEFSDAMIDQTPCSLKCHIMASCNTHRRSFPISEEVHESIYLKNPIFLTLLISTMFFHTPIWDILLGKDLLILPLSINFGGNNP